MVGQFQAPNAEFIEQVRQKQKRTLTKEQAAAAANEKDENPALSRIDGHALLRMEFPPIKWVVPGIIVEGLSIFAGPPKIGKSWIAWNLLAGVSHTGIVFGNIPVEKGDVLYLALEDNWRRAQSRLRAVLQGDPGPAPGRITVDTRWPRLDAGGLDDLKRWHDHAHNPRLILIDTWVRVKPRPARGGGNAYDDDSDAAAPLQQLANERNLAIIPFHHLRKGSADDPLEEISGTTGLTGVADNSLVLKRSRGESDASLFGTGRDLSELDLAMQFDKETGLWLKVGDGAEYRMGQERLAILRCLDAGSMSPKQVAAELSKNPSTIRTIMTKMAKAGDLVNTSGRYSLPK